MAAATNVIVSILIILNTLGSFFVLYQLFSGLYCSKVSKQRTLQDPPVPQLPLHKDHPDPNLQITKAMIYLCPPPEKRPKTGNLNQFTNSSKSIQLRSAFHSVSFASHVPWIASDY
eukprot:1125605_1